MSEHPALTFLPGESKTFGGSGRSDRFSYVQLFGGAGEVVNRVLLESGTASGRQPTVEIPLRSLVAQFLDESGHPLEADDREPFAMQLLHFRRTFVEKLFAIHAKVELLMKREGRPLGSYARHYYDLCILGGRPEVLAMLSSDEYATIKADYDRISGANFERDYVPPENMSFADSEALFPPVALAARLASEYEAQCRQLCYGAYPSWDAVTARMHELRRYL